MKNINKRVQGLYEEARKTGLKYIEESARQILRKHPHLKEFVMCMGSALFTYDDKSGNDVILSLDERSYFGPLYRFLDEWDRVYKYTGEPMRFTVNGPVVTDW